MSKIRRLSDNTEIDVDSQPYWKQGVWECGNNRFTDEGRNQYESIPDPETVPNSVTRFQAKAALEHAGLLGTVETIMANPATPILARLAWADALEFFRTSPTVAAIASALSLTDAQIDALFIQASGISA